MADIMGLIFHRWSHVGSGGDDDGGCVVSRKCINHRIARNRSREILSATGR